MPFILEWNWQELQIAWQLGKNYDQDNELEWELQQRKNKNLTKRPKLKSTQKN